MGYVDGKTIVNNRVFLVPEASLYLFGILNSTIHNAWMRKVAVRLKDDYSYSKDLVYNTFPWPAPTTEQKTKIEACAEKILKVRDEHSGSTLAELYDPASMPSDLFEAHQALDLAVEQAYGIDCQGDEEKIVAHLFGLYKEAIRKENDNKSLTQKKNAQRGIKPLKATVKVRVKVKGSRK